MLQLLVEIVFKYYSMSKLFFPICCSYCSNSLSATFLQLFHNLWLCCSYCSNLLFNYNYVAVTTRFIPFTRFNSFTNSKHFFHFTTRLLLIFNVFLLLLTVVNTNTLCLLMGFRFVDFKMKIMRVEGEVTAFRS